VRLKSFLAQSGGGVSGGVLHRAAPKGNHGFIRCLAEARRRLRKMPK
jgi:hypothetical protein